MRKRTGKTVIPAQSLEISLGVEHGELNILFSAAYEELRHLAASVKSSDPAVTLNPTALVHEAWLKLASSPAFATTNRLHFKRVAARAMRQLLIEAARRRHSRKRGGDGQAVFVTFDESLHCAPSGPEDVLKLDEALEELAALNPRHALMVEYRFFGGLDVGETAAMLEVSEATLTRDWRVVKAWLANRLRVA